MKKVYILIIALILLIPFNSVKALTVDDLKNNTVTSGDGLYSDGNGGYYYLGANPNNYITFSGKQWRILSIDSQGIKIISEDKIDLTGYSGINPNDSTKGAFDPQNYRDSGSGGAGGTYCNQSEAGKGCNAWTKNSNFVNDAVSGSVLLDAGINTYLNTTFKNSLTEKEFIVTNTTWSIGPAGTIDDTNSISQLQAMESEYTWTGDIALATKSEYMRANSNTTCLTAADLLTNWKQCRKTNYLYKSEYTWCFLSPNSSETNRVLGASSVVSGAINTADAYHPGVAVRPVLYLKSNIEFEAGGDDGNPYTITGITGKDVPDEPVVPKLEIVKVPKTALGVSFIVIIVGVCLIASAVVTMRIVTKRKNIKSE